MNSKLVTAKMVIFVLNIYYVTETKCADKVIKLFGSLDNSFLY